MKVFGGFLRAWDLLIESGVSKRRALKRLLLAEAAAAQVLNLNVSRKRRPTERPQEYPDQMAARPVSGIAACLSG